MAAVPPASGSVAAGFLPDFCRPSAVLAVVLITELVALVLTLARAGVTADASLWMDLGRISLFLLWIGLGSAAVLCYGRRWLTAMSVPVATVAALALLLAVTLAVSEAAWQFGAYWDALLPPGFGRVPAQHAGFLIRNLLICLIVSVLALRYLYVTHQWKRNVELEAGSRVSALQARIRPHFLFNSMNTIAALTRRDPAMAEEAVEDLADLFRASLRDASGQVTLKEEFELTRIYQRIEQLRLGDRLKVRWQVESLPMRARIPGLSIQPLVENAIYHGIEPLPEGGTVVISGRVREDGRLQIEIENPLPPAPPTGHRQGNRMAQVNVAERFDLAFKGRAEVRFGAEDGRYRVRVVFPRTEEAR